MKKNNFWTTVVESLVVVAIIVMWLIWLYSIYTESIKLSTTTSNRLQAINIAREWIEAVTNIRDTNWLKFSSNIRNCWMTKDYDWRCIFLNQPNLFGDWSYTLYIENNEWKLNKIDNLYPNKFNNEDYRTHFAVYVDDKWFYTQSWWTITRWTITNNPLFTREIILEKVDNNRYNVESVVMWIDSSRKRYFEVKLDTVLFNWRRN